MTLRIGVDMDGVVADFASAFRAIERDLFGVEGASPDPESSDPDAGDGSPHRAPDGSARAKAAELRVDEQRKQAVWRRIRATENFWTTLTPLNEGAVRRLHALMLEHRWDVFFITQRPATAGETIQRQTQRWLVQQGFDWPSVAVIPGSRGAAAGALRLTHHIDDSPRNCLDVKSDSQAVPILIVDPAAAAARQARQLGIGAAPSIVEALDALEALMRPPAAPRPGMLGRIAALVSRR